LQNQIKMKTNNKALKLKSFILIVICCVCLKGNSGDLKNNAYPEINEFPKNHISHKTDYANVVFKIQILSLCCHLPGKAKIFEGCGKVNEYVFNDQHKYTIGEYKTFEEALKEVNEIRKKGYEDAFIVAFVDGTRITIDNELKSLAGSFKMEK